MTCKGRRDTIQAPPLHTQEQVFTDARSTFQSDPRVELGLKYNWMPHTFGHISSISCSLMHRRCGTEAIHICTVHVGATVFFEVKNKENQAKWPQETSERFLCFTLRIPTLCALHPPLGLRSHFQLVKTPQDFLRMKWIKAHGDLRKRYRPLSTRSSSSSLGANSVPSPWTTGAPGKVGRKMLIVSPHPDLGPYSYWSLMCGNARLPSFVSLGEDNE